MNGVEERRAGQHKLVAAAALRAVHAVSDLADQVKADRSRCTLHERRAIATALRELRALHDRLSAAPAEPAQLSLAPVAVAVPSTDPYDWIVNAVDAAESCCAQHDAGPASARRILVCTEPRGHTGAHVDGLVYRSIVGSVMPAAWVSAECRADVPTLQRTAERTARAAAAAELPDDVDVIEDPVCRLCNEPMEWYLCDACGGAGSITFHDGAAHVRCEECRGDGGEWICSGCGNGAE
jgi:hypothetical protein